MRPEDRAIARKQLDKRLIDLGKADSLRCPPRGWIKAIREALGMTTAQLARRLGVSQPRVVAIEKAEKEKSVTLDTLERAAHALDCRLVYALVPRIPLDDLVAERARAQVNARLANTRHSMLLEAQSVAEADEKEQVKRLVQQWIEKSGSELWEDEV